MTADSCYSQIVGKQPQVCGYSTKGLVHLRCDELYPMTQFNVEISKGWPGFD